MNIDDDDDGLITSDYIDLTWAMTSSLWTRQGVADNIIPPGFLSSLRKNANFTPYAYLPLVLLSCAVAQHVSTIFIFLAIFLRLRNNSLDPVTLVSSSIACSIGGYVLWELLDSSNPHNPNRYANYLKAIKSAILIFLALVALAPVLRTLTAATSSDSIWALSALLLSMNALLADYTPRKSEKQIRERLTSVLSVNAAMSASVVLASRLITDTAVFALVLFSVQAFALFPILRRRLQTAPAAIQAPLTLFLAASSLLLTASLSATVTFIFLTTLSFIMFIAPAMLVWAQKYKNEIRGQWDVATPKIN